MGGGLFYLLLQPLPEACILHNYTHVIYYSLLVSRCIVYILLESKSVISLFSFASWQPPLLSWHNSLQFAQGDKAELGGTSINKHLRIHI